MIAVQEEIKAELTIAFQMAVMARGLQLDRNEALDSTLIEIEGKLERVLAILDGANENEK
jgi:hypothetical protein